MDTCAQGEVPVKGKRVAAERATFKDSSSAFTMAATKAPTPMRGKRGAHCPLSAQGRPIARRIRSAVHGVAVSMPPPADVRLHVAVEVFHRRDWINRRAGERKTPAQSSFTVVRKWLGPAGSHRMLQ
jgi:hypothetical protein